MKKTCFAAAMTLLCGIATAAASTFTLLSPITGPLDGVNPDSVVRLQDRLYGATQSGGLYGDGVVYALDQNSGRQTVLYNFQSQGGAPNVIAYNGLLYGVTTSGGASGQGSFFSIDPGTGTYTLLHSFSGADGASPFSLTPANGVIYGNAASGGANNMGAVFSLDPATGAETLLYSFSAGGGYEPAGPLLAADGLLYGTTQNGGTYNEGSVYAIDPATGTETTLYNFNLGYSGSNLAKIGNFLYGSSVFGGKNNDGYLYRLDPASGDLRIVYDFPSGGGDIAFPTGSLVSLNGILYGTTESGGDGKLFGFDAVHKTLTTLINFNFGSPNYISITDHIIYGVTGSAGADSGSIYQYDLASGTASFLYYFRNPGPGNTTGATDIGGSLYVTAGGGGTLGAGQILKVARATGKAQLIFGYNVSPDAPGVYAPESPLVSLNGALFNVTAGSVTGFGSVVRVDPLSHTATLLHTFTGYPDGSYPANGLTTAGGDLYGTTTQGGSGGGGNVGAIFKVDPLSGAETIVHSFGSAGDRAFPGVLVPFNGLLYGLTGYGGAYDAGTVFTFDPASAQETVAYSFRNEAKNGRPSVLLNVHGKFYGTTAAGRKSMGELFVFDPATGHERQLYAFQGGTDGTCYCALTSYGNTLFGTTTNGGAPNHGSIFSYDPQTDVKTTLYEFTGGADGGAPQSLVQIGGVLYGTTGKGGSGNLGTIFKLVP